MNRDNVQLLIDTIKDLKRTDHSAKDGFNMDYFVHRCGTPSCIAGYAHMLSKELDTLNAFDEGREWLGLEYDMARSLFLVIKGPYNYQNHYSNLESITPKEAVKALQNLMKGVDSDHIWDHLKGEWLEKHGYI